MTLGPLLRPLVELHWTRDVARWTGVATEEDRLRAHLFGADRVSFPVALRGGLAELQAHSCFYCGDRLGTMNQVDHFLAWSRWPNDAIENLVVADQCNGFKREHLAAADHVDRWALHVATHRSDLLEIATKARWSSDAGRSTTLVTSTYRQVVAGVPLWVEGRTFVEAEGPIEVTVSG